MREYTNYFEDKNEPKQYGQLSRLVSDFESSHNSKNKNSIRFEKQLSKIFLTSSQQQITITKASSNQRKWLHSKETIFRC